MALLRLLCFTSTNQLSTQHYSQLTSHNKPHSQSINVITNPSSLHLQRLFLAHTPILIATKQTSNSTLRLASTSQQQIQETEADAEEEFSRTRLLAQNVPWTSTPEDIRSLFEKHGKVLEVELSMYNKNRNRGLAFVEMGSPEEALAAFNSLEAYEFEGRVIKLNYARPKKKKTPPPVKPKPEVTFNLFVANLSYEARSKDLSEFFNAGTGRVVSAEVVFHDNPRRSSGYGFVSFKYKKEADAALSEFQGKDFMGRPIRVARGRRFVQQPVEGRATSEDNSSELSVNGTEGDKAD
ncbi:28 kDa ribonucleoprotein, chloroplastic [Abrus precatorius]|uniref:28 kDa ribonucleoprotein, chloroplastic n=1 Tax=Abrus precatorius TaxID=3816 RepID=A0A8B8LCV8_ABRPR|nr:28 kDa ribonucleoprotein, chloroplastic [Abrus precatorius]XP_027354056.1 28 kDa ribonucleoprotein, chloroplastic [Abrus precatorius]XP_027354057.1 28 kDa ribonucleoprotein, chloroplastic [Abrus precatorius]XP_027354058.1 28 kDa ribonucleoprotein, chloroplastic [Abrus precatorius]XP_027354059.1 28 kDa ribonucleoprotein, chloroplastic [Abrus precatorius]